MCEVAKGVQLVSNLCSQAFATTASTSHRSDCCSNATQEMLFHIWRKAQGNILAVCKKIIEGLKAHV